MSCPLVLSVLSCLVSPNICGRATLKSGSAINSLGLHVSRAVEITVISINLIDLNVLLIGFLSLMIIIMRGVQHLKSAFRLNTSMENLGIYFNVNFNY